jgi:Protein of unknown function (DUF2752)
MKITLRPLAPKETDFELLFVAVTLLVAVPCFAWLAMDLPWPKCLLRHLTGIPCPTCGATRCALALAHGNLAGAWIRNPFMFVCYVGTGLLDLYAATVVLFRLPRIRLANLPAEIKHRLCVIVAIALAINWCYLLAHH